MTTRQQVWIQAWCAVANANDCKENEVATTWADKALKAFDARFGNEKQPAEADTKVS